MLLAVDAGNSRIKWACRRGQAWEGRGAAGHGDGLDELSALAKGAERALVSCVAKGEVRLAVSAALEGCESDWIGARAKAAGVTNHYRPPESLGADRWCALLALREQLGHGTAVLAGTAVTVDRLEADGSFRGGLILPGRSLMVASLEARTGLRPAPPEAEDSADPFPDSTSAAIRSGCLRAVAGAILSQREIWGAEGEPLALAGGDAAALDELLPGAALLPDLVFDGLLLANS